MKNSHEHFQKSDDIVSNVLFKNDNSELAERLESQIDAFRSDLNKHPYMEKLERAVQPTNTARSYNPWSFGLKTSVALAIIIGAGAVAAAVGLRIYRHHFLGKRHDGTYMFSSDPEVIYEDPNGETNYTTVARGTLTSIKRDFDNLTEAENVEQMQQDLEEVYQLRQRDERELMGVTDMWVNGYFLRICHFQYILADGRVHDCNESDPDLDMELTPERIQRYQIEIDRLRKQGQHELTQIIESEVEGNIFRVYAYEYTLSDGRTQIVGEGDPDPNLSRQVISPEQEKEVWDLRVLGKGKYLGAIDREINGNIFACETYIFTLTDGTVVTHAVGERENRKTSLSDADLEELRSLEKSESGELLGITENEVQKRLFRFEKRRYILSDGTEVITSVGKLFDDLDK